MGAIRNGTLSWADLTTSNIDDARRFYADLFGWTLTRQSTEMGDYYVASIDGRDVGGMMSQSPDMAGAPAMWTAFFLVDSMEGTIASVRHAGGTVLSEPFPIPGGAEVAVIADPTGAMFALISGGPEPDAPYLSMVPGAVSWLELMSRDTEGAERFYNAVFEWKALAAPAGDVTYTVFQSGDDNVAGMLGRPAGMGDEIPDSWSIYFTAGDCAAVEHRVVELGGTVIKPTAPTPMGPFAVLADRQGAVFQVMEYLEPMTD